MQAESFPDLLFTHHRKLLLITLLRLFCRIQMKITFFPAGSQGLSSLKDYSVKMTVSININVTENTGQLRATLGIAVFHIWAAVFLIILILLLSSSILIYSCITLNPPTLFFYQSPKTFRHFLWILSIALPPSFFDEKHSACHISIIPNQINMLSLISPLVKPIRKGVSGRKDFTSCKIP